MTRVLADILTAAQPQFGLALQNLERLSGRPGHDIRLTSDMLQVAREKIRELDLDPNDTTPEELYHALQRRLERDDGILRQAIGLPLGASIDDVLRAVQRTAQEYAGATTAFALKQSVAKRLLHAVPPKQTLKALHYRSVDSMLKNESVAAIYVAARHFESRGWQKRYYAQYDRLSSADFESRKASVVLLSGTKWQAVASELSETQSIGSSVVAELGAVVVLRPPVVLPAVTITLLLLLLTELNMVRSSSTYLKLQQVSPEFTKALQHVARNQIVTDARFIDQPVPWHVLHRYYARHTEFYNAMLFEPHVTRDDLLWQVPESVLPEVHEALVFWQDSGLASYGRDGQYVSLNVLDVALNYCNGLSFAQRVSHILQQETWHELMLRYLDRAQVEQALLGKFATPQPVFAEIEPSFDDQDIR